MSVTDFRWPFAGAIGLFVVAALHDGTIGASAVSTNDRYTFSAGTDPWALGLSVVVILLYLKLMNTEPTDSAKALPTIFRRFVAFWLDFVLAMSVFAPLGGFVVIMVEWHRTGAFKWIFERATAAASDDRLMSVLCVLAMVGVVLFFVVPVFRGRPSPGACIAGYQILPDEGRTMTLRRALTRTLLGGVALSIWPIAPFLLRDREHGKFWLDKVCHTRAVFLR